jgi:hypothetical protein
VVAEGIAGYTIPIMPNFSERTIFIGNYEETIERMVPHGPPQAICAVNHVGQGSTVEF